MGGELLIYLEVLLLVLFLILSLRLVGKLIGLLVGIASWLIVGSLLFGFFIYPDYMNYKNPYVYIKIDSINETTLKFLEENKVIEVPNFDIKVNLPKELKEEYKNKFVEEYLKKNLPKEILIKNGTSNGKIYIYLSFLIKNPKLAKDALSNKIDKEDLKILLEGYLNHEIILDPELKNRQLVEMIGKYVIKQDERK
jgi:hypothetical protein